MKKLRRLYLSKCDITGTVCKTLMKSLSEHCSQFEALYLRYNNLTSDVWCHHVQMKQLRELYLSNCGIDDTVCVSLMKNLSKHCPLLEELGLSDNILSSSGVWKIVDQIKYMKKLKWLMLSGNPCMEDQKFRENVKESLQTSNPRLHFNTGY